ncbi:MAG: TIGR03545 family protein [Planctomycetota bacterium]
MIRWRYLVTRLILILAVLVLLRLGLGPAARYVTVKGLQSATGSKVDIGAADVGLFPPRIRYQDFQVADPRDGKEMRDAFRAATIELELDGQAMLHRRWVASNGRISGLQIGSRRDESGHFEPVDEDEEAYSLSDKPGQLSGMLSGITDRVEEQLEQTAEGLETVRRSREIKTRWEREYERLVKQAKSLEQKIRESKDSAKTIENPLRDWDNIGRTISLANESRTELQAVLTAIESIPGQFRADLMTLKTAKQADLDKVDAYIPGDLSQSQNMGVDLVADAVQKQIATIREYWEGGRTIAGYTVVAPENERKRGIDIDLVGDAKRPDVLVRRCEVQGLMRAGGDAYSLTGTVENLTPSPERLDQPLRAQLTLDGPKIVRVDYVRDRRGGSDIDRLTLHWPQSDAEDMDLGDDGNTRLSISGGKREIWVQMRSEGDQVQGRFVSKQTGVRIGLDVNSQFADLPATRTLRNRLSEVDGITIDAGFQGTWDDLSMNLNSNLGKLLKDATREALDEQIAVSKAKMRRKVEDTFATEHAKLLTWFNEQTSEVESLTAKADEVLQGMGRKLIDGVPSSEVTIGRMNKFLNGRF